MKVKCFPILYSRQLFYFINYTCRLQIFRKTKCINNQIKIYCI